jgi:hypothetical protein
MDANIASRADAVRFLDTLAPDGVLTFSTFTDGNRSARDPLARIIQGDYWRNVGTLAKLNARGAGCFVMVNRGDGNGRKAVNVQAVRAVFLDLDGAPLAPVMAAPIPPAIVCESSPGKHHAYWPVAGMPLANFRDAQKTLAAHYGGDPAVCDLPRVMRLPGYVHAKRESFTSRLLHCDPVMPWRWPELADALGLPHGRMSAKDGTGTYSKGERNPALYRFACGLRDQGLDQADALQRVNVANANKCQPPLDADEVAGIVASAWQGVSQGYVQLPNSLLDSPAFRALPDAGKVVILALTRNYNGANNGRIALTIADAAKHWNLSKYKRADGLKAAEAADLIECTARGMSGRPGHRATPDRFRLLFKPQ